MNSNNYQLGSGDFLLDEKAEHLMDNITFLSNERNYAKRFPMFSTIDYNGVDEDELVMHIEDLEKVYAKAEKTHHKAYLYVLDEDCKVYHNDTEYGTDINNSAPICGGRTPMEALVNAWRNWSIPPVLILNSDFFCPGVGINEVVE
ncbi:MAG: hypothetical protein IJP99_08450 [Methanobrevibacter sp.]|nr:hypothetical protein [Methanobrevibacter sp.]